jgi:hypothetical protein
MMQDFFRSQETPVKQENHVGNVPAPKEPCQIVTTGYNEDAHMTRIYFVRPLTAQEDEMDALFLE